MMSLFEFLIFILAAILVGLIGWWIFNIVNLIKELKRSVMTLDQVLVETRDTIGSFRKFSDELYPELKKSFEGLSNNSISILSKIDSIIGFFSELLNSSKRYMDELSGFKIKIGLLSKIIDVLLSKIGHTDAEKKGSKSNKFTCFIGRLFKKFI
jgi:predicted PurR-regulated permease PerM